MKNFASTINLCSFIALCVGSIFVHSYLFTDSYIVPKWLFTVAGTLAMGLLYAFRVLFGKPLKIDIQWAAIVLVAVCFALAIYGMLQYVGLLMSPSTYKITGSFDNPAGFAACLCAGLPFAGFLFSKEYKLVRYIAWGFIAISIIAIVLSHSRAGIISVAVVGCVILFQKLKRKRVWKYSLLGVLVLLLVGCYWMKKDSADGRLLIWQCSLNMAKEAPWVGRGVGSFGAHYMDYQAAYFMQHGQSRFSMLADNVKEPFNEYLTILLNFGIMGMLVLSGLIGILFYCYKKKPDKKKRIAFLALTSIGVFALFSYPFTYPFIWIVTFFSLFIITHEYINEHFFMPYRWAKGLVCISVLVCSLIGIYMLVQRVRAEVVWNKVAINIAPKLNGEDLHTYTMLESELNDNPYFLYNYAAVLLEQKKYAESLRVALKCRQYWADYDLELMIGENYQWLNKPNQAEKYYNSASMMCPCRFLPLYKLFQLYEGNNDIQRAVEMAKVINDKPMKITTPAIQMIKKEVEREMRHFNTMNSGAILDRINRYSE